MKLHEAKLLLNDPTFSIDSITYQELEMDSDYVDVHEDISYSKDNVDLHSHTFFEILFCQSGSLQYMVGNTRYQLVKNSIVCIPRCQPLSALSGTAFRTLPQNCDVDQQ